MPRNMKQMNSVYQSKAYVEALRATHLTLVLITEQYTGVRKIIQLPVVGKKCVLEARGTPSEHELEAFKEKAREYWYGLIAPTVINPNNALFEKHGFKKVSNYTIILDLTKPEEELWKQLEKKSIRWGIHVAERNNLHCSLDSTQKEINDFYQLYDQTASRGGFAPEPKEMIEILSNSPIARLVLIKSKESVVAGGLVLIDRENKYAILDLTAASDEGLSLQAMPFLYWKIIQHAKKEGLRALDLGGYDKESKEGEKTTNVNKFKERFGGVIVEQPLYATSAKYGFLRGFLKRFRFMKNLYKKEP